MGSSWPRLGRTRPGSDPGAWPEGTWRGFDAGRGRYRWPPCSTLAHWDDVEGARREAGHIGGTWRDLGTATGTQGVGVALIEVDPGKWSTPAHVEGASEEIFYVLEGSGLSWQSGEVYEVGEGDCLVHLPHREAHTLRAGPDGLRVLAFGHRVRHGNTVLPRAGVAWMYPGFADVSIVGRGRGPYAREAAAGEPEVGEPAERPASIVNIENVELVETRAQRVPLPRARSRTGRRLRAHRAFAPDHPRRSRGLATALPLGGRGDLRGPRRGGHAPPGRRRAPVRPGHVVGRPPGTGVSHSFRAGGSDLVYLAYGTREPNDIAYYPRSGKVSLRGVGVMGRIEPLGYWEGEP